MAVNLVLITAFASCLGASLAFRCNPPHMPNYGGYSDRSDYYSVGKRVHFFCNRGYSLVGQRYSVCSYDYGKGKAYWKYPSPVCRPHNKYQCPYLPDPDHGNVKLTGKYPGSKATYSCKFGYRLVGQYTRKCQSNGKWDGEAPKCVLITCPDLPDPQYGFVEVTGNRVECNATYYCNYGFELVGNSRRVCQGSGTWSGEAPTCKPITCPDLDDPKYGSVSLTGNRVGDYANYKCDFGFRISGDRQRVCLGSGEWSGSAPTCVVITCPDLEAPQYGSVSLTGNKVGNYANYQCDSGFTLEGESQRKCEESGFWSGEAPSCVAILCPDLANPENGNVETTDNRVGDVAYYQCDYGFELQGERQRTCQLSGEWSGEAPICVAITCPELENPQYGEVDVTGDTVGSIATYVCNVGFRIVGGPSRRCMVSGEWSGEAPTCIATLCPDLEAPQYGSVSLTGNRVGSYANYECDSGFTLDGDSRRQCQVSGEWSGEAPSCVAILCPELEDPENGFVETTDNRVGDVADYQCDYGFALEGDSQRACLLSGEWSGEAPTCVAITCPDLDEIANADLTVTGNNPGDTATYFCNVGFRISGGPTRRCQVSGEWSGEEPTCIATLCPDLEAPQYGSVSLTGNRVGSYANYECDSGFELSGSSRRQCGTSGFWSGEAPSCVAILCPELDNPDNGNVETTDNRVGDVADYQCAYGFELQGDSQRTCQLSGEWSGEAPTCVAITCPDLDDPKYGSVTLTGNRVGYYANYVCNSGFRLTGDRQRVCLITGEWSGVPPTCVPITCPDLEDPKYGSVTLTGNKVGSYANYKCDVGFRLEGSSQRRCQLSGQWSGSAPACIRIKCPALDDPKYGFVKVTGNKVGDTATYGCDYGFNLVGVPKRQCLPSGKWSGQAPTCQRIQCPKLNPPLYGYVEVGGLSPGSTAHYSCKRNFRLVGTPWRKCQKSGVWSGDDVTCEPVVDCGPAPSPKYGSVKFSSTSENAQAYYYCSQGFNLVGSSVRWCQSNSHWSGSLPDCVPVYPRGYH